MKLCKLIFGMGCCAACAFGYIATAPGDCTIGCFKHNAFKAPKNGEFQTESNICITYALTSEPGPLTKCTKLDNYLDLECGEERNVKRVAVEFDEICCGASGQWGQAVPQDVTAKAVDSYNTDCVKGNGS